MYKYASTKIDTFTVLVFIEDQRLSRGFYKMPSKDKLGWNQKINKIFSKTQTQRRLIDSAGGTATASQSGSQSTQSSSNITAASVLARKLLNNIVSDIDLDNDICM